MSTFGLSLQAKNLVPPNTRTSSVRRIAVERPLPRLEAPSLSIAREGCPLVSLAMPVQPRECGQSNPISILRFEGLDLAQCPMLSTELSVECGEPLLACDFA